jgi:acetolactate synthase regulatory subunit
MKMKQLFALAGITLGICLLAGQSRAQGGPGGFGGGGGRGFGGGNYDPAQMQQQLQEAAMSLYREQLEVKDDAEWKVIGDQVKKVMDAQTQVGPGGGANLLRAAVQRMRNNNGGQDFGNTNGGGGRRAAGMAAAFGGQTDPEMLALQKAIDGNASNEALKAAMTKVMDVRKAKQAKLEEAQVELRKLLTVRQEAVALSLGLF